MLRLVEKSGSVTNSDENAELARKISALAGGLPIFISQISGYIKGEQCSLPKMIDLLQASNPFLDDIDAGPDERTYERPISSLYDSSMRLLSKPMIDFLFMLAFYHSNIDQSLLVREHQDQSLSFLPKDEQRYYIDFRE